MSFIRQRFKISEERMEICRTCEFYNERTTQCKKCGCFMAAKTLLKDSSCPIGKWNEYVDE